MSSVWKAHHAETGQDYALKILHGSMIDDENARQRFFEEGLIQSRIAHPNIVSIKGRIEAHPVHALVMEFIDGPSLDKYVKDRPAGLFLSEVKTISTGILSGLNAAHRRGVIHRDVKPSNVMLARDYYSILPKITDFGIAKVKYGRLRTVTSAPMGTPHFMSPEQLRDSRKVTAMSDIYSFGVTLYFMVTGRYPFDHQDLNKLMIRIIKANHPRAITRRRGLSQEIDDLIAWCMQPKAADRPEACREVLERILAIDWTDREPPSSLPDADDDTASLEMESSDQFYAVEAQKVDPVRPGPPPVPVSKPGPSPNVQVNMGDNSGWVIGDENDVDFDMAMAPFRSRSRLPTIIAFVLLAVGVAFGTKTFLEWQRAEGQTPEAAASETVADGNEPDSGDDDNRTASNDPNAGDLQGPAEPLNQGSADPSSSDGSGQSSEGLETQAAAEGSGQPLAEVPSENADANQPPDGEPQTDEVAVVQPDDSETEAVLEDPNEEPDEPDEPDEPEETEETEETEEEAAARRERRAERRRQRERNRDEPDISQLTGREAERAAELAWERRQRDSTGQNSGDSSSSNQQTSESNDTDDSTNNEQVAVAAPAVGDESLSPTQINSALGSRRTEFRACFEDSGSPDLEIQMRIRIRSDGQVEFARSATSTAPPNIQRCLVETIRSVQFDAFDGPSMNIRKTFGRIGPLT